MVVLCRDESAHSNGAFCTGLVFDNDRLAPSLGKPIGKYTSRRIIGASRRKRPDQFYRPLWPTRSSSIWNINTDDTGNR